MTVAPYPLAMVVCDAVWRDPGTGKFFILGTFTTIHSHTFPATHPQLAVYVSLTDGRGTIPVKLTLVSTEQEDVELLFEAELEFEFNDPRMIAELVFTVQGVAFPKPGEYRFQLFAGGDFVIERRILLIQLRGDKTEKAEEGDDDE